MLNSPPVLGVRDKWLNILPRHNRASHQVTPLRTNPLRIVNQPTITPTLMPPSVFTIGLLHGVDRYG
jgi:hypothetical protein